MVELINEEKRKGVQPPVEMLAIWNYEHEKLIKEYGINEEADEAVLAVKLTKSQKELQEAEKKLSVLQAEIDGEREIPVTGISISGKLSTALSNMRLSSEETTYESYRGPKCAIFDGIEIV